MTVNYETETKTIDRIEQRFPKPKVGGSTPSGTASNYKYLAGVSGWRPAAKSSRGTHRGNVPWRGPTRWASRWT